MLDCPGCEPLNEAPQPAKASTRRKSSTHCVQRSLPPESPRKHNGAGNTRAHTSPAGACISWLLLAAPMVIFVLSGALPESVGGAKLHADPLGRPVQAKDNEALNPFSGATETIRDPDVPCVMVSVLPDSVKP